MGGRGRTFIAAGAMAGLLGIAVLGACASEGEPAGGGQTTTPDGGEASSGFIPDSSLGDSLPPGIPEEVTRDPETCEEAKTTRSYVGCDYWPTVTVNPVWSIFDFAVAVANTGTKEATVTVTGPLATNKTVTIPAGQLRKIFLPWVPELKGPDADECLNAPVVSDSHVAAQAAFHVVSTSPVVVYQFNTIEYKGQGGEAPGGGPKDWSACPGSTTTCTALNKMLGCFSFSSDASLLLPTTAMTRNYRVVGQHGFTLPNVDNLFGSSVSVTATEPNTKVTVTLSPAATLRPSVDGAVAIPAKNGGEVLTFTLANAGDVARLLTEPGDDKDFSGSLVQADKPIQVISSVACINIPPDKGYCDHIEEIVLPAEVLGKRYVIHAASAPKGTPAPYNLRVYGNKDNTTLTYNPARPSTCPTMLNAGQVVDCGVGAADFEVSGDNEFGVATFLLGSTALDPSGADLRGDPSQTTYAALEQFRTKYVFLAPDDFSVNYVDITAPEQADVVLDGVPVAAPFEAVGKTGLGVYHVKLGAGQAGQHVLTSKKPTGIQVVGYGDFTSYQYPGGLNLKLVAPPPPPPK